jgi:hypothetical protein
VEATDAADDAALIETRETPANPKPAAVAERVSPRLESRPVEAKPIAEPLLAAVAAPPAGPVAPVAAGLPSPTPTSAVQKATASPGRVFVPDFSGQSMSHARRLAHSESLTIDVFGATNGRVVSQLPVPGTVLEGSDRTILLEFAPQREDVDATL